MLKKCWKFCNLQPQDNTEFNFIMSLNKVMLIGNVGNDPEVRYLESNPRL